MNSKICADLQDGIGTFGLTGLDKFFSFMIVQKLQTFQKVYHREVRSSKPILGLHREIAEALMPLSSTPDSLKPYQIGVQRGARLWSAYAEVVLFVGHIQLIRRHIASELNFSCHFDSKFLSSTLHALNDSLLTDVRAHYTDPTKPYPGEIMVEASSYLECAGMANPLHKIYVTTKKLDFLPVNIFLFVRMLFPSPMGMTAGFVRICRRAAPHLPWMLCCLGDSPAAAVGLQPRGGFARFKEARREH